MSLLLSPDELVEITNGLTQPAAQLKALHALGFVRASRPRKGPVVLSRAHYMAVEEHRAGAASDPEHNGPADAAGVVVGLQAWAAARKGRGGQKAQGR